MTDAEIWAKNTMDNSIYLVEMEAALFDWLGKPQTQATKGVIWDSFVETKEIFAAGYRAGRESKK